MTCKVLGKTEVILDRQFIEEAIINHVNKIYPVNLKNDGSLVWSWTKKAMVGDKFFAPGQVTITKQESLEEVKR